MIIHLNVVTGLLALRKTREDRSGAPQLVNFYRFFCTLFYDSISICRFYKNWSEFDTYWFLQCAYNKSSRELEFTKIELYIRCFIVLSGLHVAWMMIGQEIYAKNFITNQVKLWKKVIFNSSVVIRALSRMNLLETSSLWVRPNEMNSITLVSISGYFEAVHRWNERRPLLVPLEIKSSSDDSIGPIVL